MKKLFVTPLFLLMCGGVFAQGVTTELGEFERQKKENYADSLAELQRKSKPKLKFGARLEARLYYDSYNSVDLRNGALYFYPKAPTYDPSGADLNQQGQVRFSVFTSRLNFGVSEVKVGKSKMNAYVETDFLGPADNYLQILRLRHLYVNFVWKTNELLVGQTNTLMCVDEILPSTILTAGFGFNAINRGAQVRYTHLFSPRVKLLAAAEYYTTGMRPVGPENQQAWAKLPDMQVQMKFGDPNKLFGGFTFGAKFLQPRTVDASGYKTTKTISSLSGSAFLRFNLQGYLFRLNAIYGSNLSPNLLLGGYAKLLSDSRTGDYSYANTQAVSAFVDFETPSYKGVSFGFFAGYQTNLGSRKPLDLKQTQGVYDYAFIRGEGVMWYSRVAPRIYYEIIPKLIVGAEYSYNAAIWGKKFDEYYRSTEDYPQTANNRIELLLQYCF